MAETIFLEVQRYRPERDEAPSWQSYEVPCRREWTVLDALNHVKDNLDGTLSYRWACRLGVCGSCGMMVDGEPVLTCAAYLERRLPGPVRVAPLKHFPVIRDLVVDVSGFLEKLKAVKPWIVREDAVPLSEGEYRQTPDELERYKQESMCINCMLCYSACPIVPLEPSFLGPAVIALAQRYNQDSRDRGAKERRAVLLSQEGIWSCTFVGECSAVCPKKVDPAGAIQRAKVQGTLEWLKSVVLPWGR